MATDARRLAIVRDVHLLVTNLARAFGLRGRVRRVTARASGVRRHRRGEQRRLGTVAPEADLAALGHEVVRLVTSEARVMARRLRSSRL